MEDLSQMIIKKGFWKKKDGKMIKIEDMEDMHLVNVLEMYKKEAIDQYADPNQNEMIWVEGSLSVDRKSVV